jgi:hypothetical protein
MLTAGGFDAAGADCAPCAGIAVADPAAVMSLLRDEPALGDDAPFVVRYPVPLDGSGDAAADFSLSDAGATPMLRLEFRVPSPIATHAEHLAAELEAAARLAGSAPGAARFQIFWARPLDGADAVREYAFLLKRASVAVKGARGAAHVTTMPIPPTGDLLDRLYDADIGAYIDAIALAPGMPPDIETAMAAVAAHDPGRAVALDALPLPDDPAAALAHAARWSAAGAAMTLFETDPRSLDRDALTPLRLLAREFSGEISYDPSSTPTGAAGAWAFVRAEDLGLRVIVDRGVDPDHTQLVFPEPRLSRPVLVEPDGSTLSLMAWSADAGYTVPLDTDDRFAVLRLERPTAAELGGFESELAVDSKREMPVREILHRLQAFDDAQARRLHHYEAIYAQHLRFRPRQGLEAVEVSFRGPFFFRQGKGFDWVWERFFFNGVRWQGAKIPQLPLLQPARASARPLEIHLDRQYSYRLRGTASVDGRSCWVVDFEPAASADGQRLHRGTVWVDRSIYARVKTRTLQVGLTGEVISNEETMIFEPVDADGLPADWAPSSFILPTRVVAQELQSILNTAVHVEKESLLTEIRINREGIEDRLRAAHDSKLTMLRDTPDGLRYLRRTEGGEREVQQGFDEDRWFLAGGTYWDETLDFPLPLAGVNYFSNDLGGTGTQANLLFAGVLVNGNWADPSLLGSRWDAGARLFGLFIKGDRELYRSGLRVKDETVEAQNARLALFLGRPLGSFAKLDLTYALDRTWFGRADDTAENFVVPESTFVHSVAAELSYTRAGYRVGVVGSHHSRSDWSFWGSPDNDEYDPSQKDFRRWRVTLSKNWWISGVSQFGLELQHVDGADLDRFSKYDFDNFGDAQVAGYPGGLVTASEGHAVHVQYGFNIADVFRVEARGDAAWATDEATGLDNELIAGIGLGGTVMGPWSLIVNFELGLPVEGPADTPTVSLLFLKLFN